MAKTLSKTLKLKDGRILGYIEYGDPKGKPLFFFHGWPGSRYSGKETNEAANKLGIRIISADRPGMGLSDFKADRRLLDWPDDVIQLADFLKIKRFALLGVSGGGPYVLSCCYKIPGRIIKAGIVVGLAPVNVKGNLEGMAFQGRAGWANYRRFPLLRTIATFGAALEFCYFPGLGSIIGFPSKADRTIYDYYMKKSGKVSALKEAFRRGIKGESLELKIYTDDWGIDFSKIKTKVYLWYGAKDKSVSLNMGRYYKKKIPDSTLYIEPLWSHLSRYAHEEKILKILTR